MSTQKIAIIIKIIITILGSSPNFGIMTLLGVTCYMSSIVDLRF